MAFESASSASERANADAAAFPGGNVNESRGSYRILKIPRSREVIIIVKKRNSNKNNINNNNSTLIIETLTIVTKMYKFF